MITPAAPATPLFNVPAALVRILDRDLKLAGSKRFAAGAQPTVRVWPAVPMRYRSGGWDFGWLLPRTDGTVFRWLCDPYTLGFQKSTGRYLIGWFAR